MSLTPRFPSGYYDDAGMWQRTKFCFVYCGAACTCGPPLGQVYSPSHDKTVNGENDKAPPPSEVS